MPKTMIFQSKHIYYPWFDTFHTAHTTFNHQRKGKIHRRNRFIFEHEKSKIETRADVNENVCIEIFYMSAYASIDGPFCFLMNEYFTWMLRKIWFGKNVASYIWACEHCMVMVWCYYVTSRYTSSMPGCLAIRCISVMSCMISCLVSPILYSHIGVCIMYIRYVNDWLTVLSGCERNMLFNFHRWKDVIRLKMHTQLQFHMLFEPVFLPCGIILNEKGPRLRQIQ